MQANMTEVKTQNNFVIGVNGKLSNDEFAAFEAIMAPKLQELNLKPVFNLRVESDITVAYYNHSKNGIPDGLPQFGTTAQPYFGLRRNPLTGERNFL
jgi:hypothetical protein